MNAARVISLLAITLSLLCPAILSAQSSTKPPRKDALGDPLPDGAVKRLGTTRLQHLRTVRQVAFTPDGKRLISIGDDFVSSVWDVATGKEVRREFWGDPKLPLDAILANDRLALMLFGRADSGAMRHITALISGDGHYLVLCRDEKARILDAETGKHVSETFFKVGKTLTLELAPDGKTLARFAMLQDFEPELTIIDIASGKQLHKLRNSGRYYTGIRFSPDGKFLATRDSNNHVCLFDLANGKRIRLFEGHEGVITSIRFVPGEAKVASAATDGVWLWDHTSDDAVAKFPLEDISFCAAAFSPSGKVLATSGKQDAVFLWDVAGVTQTRAMAGHTGHVTTLAFSSDGKTIASGASDGTIRLWDASDGRDITPCKHLPRVHPIGVVKPGVILAQAETGATLHHLSDTTGEITATFPGPVAPNPGQPFFAGMTISPNGKFLALLDVEHPVGRVYNVPENREAFRIEGHPSRINRMAFSGDADLLATLCTQDRTMRIWNTQTGKVVHKLDLPFYHNEEAQLVIRGRIAFAQPVNETLMHEIAFSPDRRSVIWVAPDGVGHQWELASGKLRNRVPLSSRQVAHLTYSPSGRLIAAVTNDDTLRVCDAVDGKLVHGFVSRDGDVRTIAFSPDSRLLAAGCGNGKIVVYDMRAGKEKRSFVGHQTLVQKLWFADEGKTLVSASLDGTMLFWDLNAPLSAPEIVAAPNDARLDALWMRLGNTDATDAFDAIAEFTRHPLMSVKYLQTKLEPTQNVAAERVKQLLTNLDNASYAVRDKASEDLTRIADQIIPALQKAQSESMSSEKTRRLSEIFEKASEQRSSPENLRLVRAVEALERIGTADAASYLQVLAGGAPGAILTTAARDAVERLRAER